MAWIEILSNVPLFTAYSEIAKLYHFFASLMSLYCREKYQIETITGNEYSFCQIQVNSKNHSMQMQGELSLSL